MTQRSTNSMRIAILAMMLCAVGCSNEPASPPGAPKTGESKQGDKAKPVSPSSSSTGSSSPTAKNAAPAVEGWGTLRGKFVFDGTPPTPAKLNITKDVAVCGKHNLIDESLLVDKSGGVQNVVVYVRSKGVKVHPDLVKSANERVILDNKGCRFDPHVLVMQTGQPLTVKNSDPVGHNSNIQPIGDTAINPLLPAAGDYEQKFTRAQTIPVPVTCNIHPWMTGYILPRDNPYAAVSNPDGSFEIKNLPAGELEFQAWHEKAGYISIDTWDKGRFTQTIQPGDNDLGVKKLPATLFSK